MVVRILLPLLLWLGLPLAGLAQLDRLELVEGASVSAAVVRPDTVEFMQAGAAGIDADSLFEIGSITKVFTALATALQEARKPGFLGQPLVELLPELEGKATAGITPRELATHTSGLPRLPPTMNVIYLAFNRSDPYAKYDRDSLIADLKRTRVNKGAAGHAYSNYGYAVLGLALERADGREYPQIIREELLGPLGMDSSFMAYTPELEQKVVPGFGDDGRPAPVWHHQASSPAGSIISTTGDMARFLQWCLSSDEDALGRALTLSMAEQQQTGGRHAIGLGWQIIRGKGGTVYWHNGGTGAYRSFMGMMPEHGAGVVLLCNDAGVEDLDGAGIRLLLDAARDK